MIQMIFKNLMRLELNDESLELIRNLLLNEFDTTLFFYEIPSRLIGVISIDNDISLDGIKKTVYFDYYHQRMIKENSVPLRPLDIFNDKEVIHCAFTPNDVTDKYPDLIRPWYKEDVHSDEHFYSWVESLHPGYIFKNRNLEFIDHLNLDYGTHILDNLIISGDNIYRFIDSIEKYYVINVSNTDIISKNLNTINYIHLPILEFNRKSEICSQNEENMHKAIDLIHQKVTDNILVFLHCAIGRNRSPCVTLMYLMKYYDMTLKEAYFYLATRRLIKLGFHQATDILKYAKSKNKDDGICISKLACDTFRFGSMIWSWNLQMYDLYIIDQIKKKELESHIT